MQPSTARIALLLGAAALTASACTSLLGDFTVSQARRAPAARTPAARLRAPAVRTPAARPAAPVTRRRPAAPVARRRATAEVARSLRTSPPTASHSPSCASRHSKPDSTCEGIPIPAGMGSLPQIAGDCKTAECDGAGSVVYVDDPLNMEDDKDDCTEDTCFGGAPKHTLAGPGAACSVPGNVNAQMCDDNGDCVECMNSGDSRLGSASPASASRPRAATWRKTRESPTWIAAAPARPAPSASSAPRTPIARANTAAT